MPSISLPSPGQKPWNLNPAITALNDEMETGRLSVGQLNATFAGFWKPLTAYTAGQQVIAPNGSTVVALADFTSGATYSDANWRIGTNPANAPVAKPSTDTRPGVWEYTHNSGTGYLFHLLAGSSFAKPASLIALGLDNGNGGGLLVANKKSGVGITIRQQATINDAAAYGLKVDGLSTVAPSIRIEQNVNGAADAMQLLAFGTPTATQNLLLVSAAGGNAGFIRALNGDIDWRRNITVRDKDGSTISAFMAGENSAFATWGDVAGYWTQLHKKGLTFYSPSGGGSLWPFQIVGAGSRLQFLTGAAGAYGATPTNKVLEFQDNKIGFLGVNPVARPAALVQTYATSTRTLGAYTSDPESSAYTGTPADAASTAKLADLNALRVAYENLRVFVENLAGHHNALVDDLQLLGLEQ